MINEVTISYVQKYVTFHIVLCECNYLLFDNLPIMNIGYCVLEIDMGRETLHGPKWSWYVQIIVGHIDKWCRCSDRVFVDVNLGMID